MPLIFPKRLFQKDKDLTAVKPWEPSEKFKRMLERKRLLQPTTEGFVFEVQNNWVKLDRFLQMGTDSCLKYQAEEQNLLRKNATCIDNLINNGEGEDVVKYLRDASICGDNPKPRYLLFALAICARSNDIKTKRSAYDSLSSICRIPTHLFLFIRLCHYAETKPEKKSAEGTNQEQLPGDQVGWGRAHKRGICNWYEQQAEKDPLKLARLLTKYKNRAGWTHRDIFRLTHIKPKTESLKIMVCYFLGKSKALEALKKEHFNSLQEERKQKENIENEIDKLKEEKQMHLGNKKNDNGNDNPENSKTLHDLEFKLEKKIEELKAVKEQMINMENISEMEDFLEDIDTLRQCTDEEMTVALVKKHGLEIQHVHTSMLQSKKVWQALAETMQMTALLKNLKKLTSLDILSCKGSGQASILDEIEKAFTDQEKLKNARVHPVAILQALKVYKEGKPLFRESPPRFNMYSAKPRRSNSKKKKRTDKKTAEWNPDQKVVDILQKSFELSLDMCQPSGKQILLAIDTDTQGKTRKCFGDSVVTPLEAAATFALMMLKSETNENCLLVTFSKDLKQLDIDKKSTLTEAMDAIDKEQGGPVDCALPMIWAMKKKLKYDVFIVLTGNQTDHGEVYPHEALNMYNEKMKRNAKLVVVAMAVNDFTIAKPGDENMLDVAGFNGKAISIITEFMNGVL